MSSRILIVGYDPQSPERFGREAVRIRAVLGRPPFPGIDANCANHSADGCIESFDISHGFPSQILNSHALVTSGASASASGIITDNVSSAGQASSIYFESFTPTQSAIKITQSSLQ